MHLPHFSSTWTDHHGRLHISHQQMDQLYQSFHTSLEETYWESASNQKICTDGMETMKKTHISKRNISFLLHFASLVKEIYSHAHYNLKQLLYEKRDEVIDGYWKEIERYYQVISDKCDQIYNVKTTHKLAIQLLFASLYGLYKQVADPEFIEKIFLKSSRIFDHDIHKLNAAEKAQTTEYFESIQLIHRLRHQQDGDNKPRELVHEMSKAPQLPLFTETEVMESLIYRKERGVAREILGLPHVDDGLDDEIHIASPIQILHVHIPSPPITPTTPKLIFPPSSSRDIPPPSPPSPLVDAPIAKTRRTTTSIEKPMEEEKRENIVEVKRDEIVREDNIRREEVRREVKKPPPPIVKDIDLEDALKRLQPINKTTIEVPVQSETLVPFDPKTEFERRFAQKKSTQTFNVPVIPKPNKEDTVQSYRRRGLFNEIDATKLAYSRKGILAEDSPARRESISPKPSIIRRSRESSDRDISLELRPTNNNEEKLIDF